MIASRLRTTVRLVRVGLHLAYGSCLVGIVYPLVDGTARFRLRRHWSRALLEILNIRLRRMGVRDAGQGMLVANHVSWVDVFVISSICDPHFVCKNDVRHWPVIGWLCARNGAVFIDRRRRSDGLKVSAEIAARLQSGTQVAVFPEGTTSDGAGLLPFRNALLQAAVDARSLVLPVALRYLDADGHRTSAPAFCGEDTLWRSLCSIAAQSELTAEVRMLPAIACADLTRRMAGEQAHARIRACLESSPAIREMPDAGASGPVQAASLSPRKCRA